jgi:predicted NUDIX family phosphoesterase
VISQSKLLELVQDVPEEMKVLIFERQSDHADRRLHNDEPL